MLRKPISALKAYLALLNMDPSAVARLQSRRPPRPETKDTPRWVNLALFIITFLTTTLAGAQTHDGWRETLISGLPFSATLMAILLTHEMGHYLAARRFGLRATLPFFIPLPHWISPIGTLGAVIKVKSPIMDRRTLLYVGAMGPLAGFAVSITAVVVGIQQSEMTPLPVIPPDGFFLIFGDSLLFKLIAFVFHGPAPPGHDLLLSPYAWAGWIGFLITSLNLMPMGQLDGGHIVHALAGRRQLYAGWAAFATLVFLAFIWPWWIVWILIALFFLKIGHPPVDDPLPLTPGEHRVGWACMLILVLTFVPVPVELRDNDGIYLIDAPSSEIPLEPSGLAMYDGKLVMISDNAGDTKIFRLEKHTKGYAAHPFIDLKIRPSHSARRLDLEGIAVSRNLFYLADERNRAILVSDINGNTGRVQHDIHQYNRKKGIRFYGEENAGFEGIAVDSRKNRFFIANEREPALIYELEKKGDGLSAVSHIDMAKITGRNDIDISDLFFEKAHLYVLVRISNEILKIDPRDNSIVRTINFSHMAHRLYVSEKKYGFAEGLCMDETNIYLAFDSNGNPLPRSSLGKNGALVIMPRPRNF